MNVRVMFRIFFPGDPDYGQAVPAEGEVALYQECNYGGPVTMFATDIPDLSALSGSTVTLDRTTASVRLGSNRRPSSTRPRATAEVASAPRA